MILIKLLLILSVLTILINLFNIIPKIKIFINLILSSFIIVYFSENSDILLVNILSYMCCLYILLNIYATRYSSIRIRLINLIIFKKKLINETALYQERYNRFNKKNNSIMAPRLFKVLNIFVKFFRYIFI